MTSSSGETRTGRIREPLPTSGPTLHFDLAEEVRRLEAEQPWQAKHTANTIVKYPDLRVVLVALQAGTRLEEHQAAGTISIQVLSGTIRVQASDRAFELQNGQLLTLQNGLRHAVEAVANSVFLLTLAWPSGQ
jgi:quercetin dioxygenase-like cupin family protein